LQRAECSASRRLPGDDTANRAFGLTAARESPPESVAEIVTKPIADATALRSHFD
jgi:hypothetical protein